MVSHTTGPAHAPIPDDTDPWGLLPNTIRDMATAFDLWISTLRPLAQVSRTGDQTIGASSETTIVWQSEDVDTLGAVNLGTSNTNLVIPAGASGLYAITLFVRWTAFNTSLTRLGRIRVNGNAAASGGVAGGSGGLISQHSTSCIVPLVVGDVVTASAWQNGAGNESIGISGSNKTNLLLARL